jgi:1-phosphatidylinositol-4-phosphate 5-kinase
MYVGQFQDGEPDGEGIFTWPSGDHYTGQWKMGKKHGKGVFAWKTGDRWEGVYENDVQKN